MSKRRSESNFNSKEENFDESNSKHKRRKLNEEGDDGSFEDISDADNCDVITPDEPCDQLLNIFFRIITDLHQYNKGGTISRKSQRGQDMKKLELVEMNHDESVRLEQEADELELKTSKDKDKYKESKTILPKESKEESHKRLEDENEVNYRNYQLQTLQALTNMTYYDPRKFLKENEESNSQLHILICKLIYKRKNKKNWLLNSEFKSKLVDSPKNCDEPKEIKEKLQQKSNFIPQQQTIKEEVPKQISPPIPENIQIPPMSQAMNIPKNNIPQSLSPEIVMGAIKSSNQPMQNQMLMNLFNKSSMKFSNPMNRNTQSPNVMQMMQQQSSLPSQNYQLPGLTNVGLNLEKNKMLPVSNPFPYMPMNPAMMVPDRRPIPENFMMKGNNYNQGPYSNFPMSGGMQQQLQLPRLNHISSTLNLPSYPQQPHQSMPFLNPAQFNKMLANQPRMQPNPHLGMYQNNPNHPMLRTQQQLQDFNMQNQALHPLSKPPMKPNQYPYSK